jgi:hypothetical protein
MEDFFAFMRCQGVKDPEALMKFVTQFLEDPGIINKFPKDKLRELEKQLDCALAPFSHSSSNEENILR